MSLQIRRVARMGDPEPWAPLAHATGCVGRMWAGFKPTPAFRGSLFPRSPVKAKHAAKPEAWGYIIVALLLIAGTARAIPPDPNLTAGALLHSRAILLVKAVKQGNGVLEYSVPDRLLGESEPLLTAPPPFDSTLTADTLLLLLPQDISTRNARNRLRVRYGLPLKPLPPHRLFSWAQAESPGIIDLAALLPLNRIAAGERLLSIALREPGSWRGATADAMLSQLAHGTLLENGDFRETAFAAQLSAYPLSPRTLSTLAEDLRREYPAPALPPLLAILDTISFTGKNAEVFGPAWQVVSLLLDWPDPRGRAEVERRLAEYIMAGIPPSSSLVGLFVRLQTGDTRKGDSPIASAVRSRSRLDRPWTYGEIGAVLNLAPTLSRKNAAEVFYFIAAALSEGRYTGKVSTLSLRKPLGNVAAYLEGRAVPSLTRIIRHRELRESGIARYAVEALGRTGDPAAADTLISLVNRSIYRKTALRSLAGMPVTRAWKEALRWVKTDLQMILKNRGRPLKMSDIESAAALGVLASRGAELPAVEPLLLNFARKAPAEFRIPALETLFSLPTEASADYVLPRVPKIPPSLFPRDLAVLENLPSSRLAPWLGRVVAGEINLPDWRERQKHYVRSAIRILAADTSAPASMVLLQIAGKGDGKQALTALSALEKRDALPGVERLARLLFMPRKSWNPVLPGRILESGKLSVGNRREIALLAAAVVNRNLEKYDTSQLLQIALFASDPKRVGDFEALLVTLADGVDQKVRALAGYGLAEIKTAPPDEANPGEASHHNTISRK